MVWLVLLTLGRSVVISEVMANPAGGSGAHSPEDRNEFVELYNDSTEAVDLYEWVLDDGDAQDRLVAWTDSGLLAANPTSRIDQTWLNPGCYAVVLDSEYLDPNPVGGYVQPYRFGDSALVLTTRNTTIGNGLATTDPVFLITPYGDTVSTFGTPMDAGDSLPCNPGDGISWERVHLGEPDCAVNWRRCVDSSGSTPGRANSASSIVDLAVAGLRLTPGAGFEPGQRITCSMEVVNRGTQTVEDWRVMVWLDADGDRACSGDERVAELPGLPVQPAGVAVRSCSFGCPGRQVDLWAVVICPADRDSSDNRAWTRVVPGGSRLLRLGYRRFSPNSDGMEDSLPIAFELPEPGGRLSISVFDLGGRLRRRVVANTAQTVSGQVFWDGRDDSGRVLDAGIYAVVLDYERPVGTAREKLPVVLLRD